MLPEPRAVVFDLDNTLYPQRRFLVSGFAAVASSLSETHGLDRSATTKLLVRTSRGVERGRELQVCLRALGLPLRLIPDLLDVFRRHEPRIRLPRRSLRMLCRLRAEGWRLGVLTNGPRTIQARKVSALRLSSIVDAVVFATEHGSGAGKPDPEPFAEILDRLDVPAANAVFVGDDEVCDIAGAARLGLRTIRCDAWAKNGRPSSADLTVQTLGIVPASARLLLEEVPSRHVA